MVFWILKRNNLIGTTPSGPHMVSTVEEKCAVFGQRGVSIWHWEVSFDNYIAWSRCHWR
jgi:hypothetical protein